MYPRLINPLKTKSFFLFGARGTGKTKLLEGVFPRTDTLWVDLLQAGEFLVFSRNPTELRERIREARRRNPALAWIVIDEVQRLPALLTEVHSLIEAENLRFALTGSSARKLRRGGADMLAGRALVDNLYPLTFLELGPDFILEDVLHFGSLPAVATETNAEVRQRQLQAYVDVYLREEIREEQIIRRLDPFSRFLQAAAQSSGSIINLSRIGREAGTDAKSVARYFQILDDTLLGLFVDPYHRSIRKRQRSQAKFYLFDNGVRRALEGSLRTRFSPSTYEWGRAFEHLVVLEAIRLNSYFHADYRFSYLRTQNQREIDLIAERHGELTWVIEIKSAANPDPVDIDKLAQLARDIPQARPAIFCTALHARFVNGVTILHWQDGLRQMFPESVR